MAAISGLCPIGSIIYWAVSLNKVPSLQAQGRNEWAPCNGQTITDQQSPMNGVVLPNINGSFQFLRGSATSGGTGGTDAAHSHTLGDASSFSVGSGGGFGMSTSNGSTGTTDGRPAFYNAQALMRIK